jgi:IS5 family transposase
VVRGVLGGTGEAGRPTEFGKLVKIQEAEARFITDDPVGGIRVPGQTLWEPSLVRHRQLFGRPSRLAVVDGGFASRATAAATRSPRSSKRGFLSYDVPPRAPW